MERKVTFDYFYGSGADAFSFYRIPKLLFTYDYFKGLSTDAKVLYGLMLDRMGLSVKNRWFDSDNRAYIYFSIEDAMELLNCGKNKAIKSMQELDSEQGIGLIEKRRQGMGKANIIYVKSFSVDEGVKFNNQTSGEVENTEVYNSNRSLEQTSRGLQIKLPEVYIEDPNNTKINKTEMSNTESNLILSADGMDVVEGGFANQPTVDVASLTDYDQMKDKLIMEVVSIEANEDMLAKVPHQEMEDMAVVYRFVIDSNDDGRATILVTNQLLETMGVTPEQLHADAMENAPELKPAVIKGMSEVMAEMMGMSAEDLAMMGMPTDPANEQMFVATVPDKIHGAGIIAYQDFMDQASERIGGGDFFVLPSSIHEILIVPDNGQMSLGDLEAMVKEVNATQVAPEDKLTDSVYHYDSQAKIFELGEKFVERQAEKEAGIEAEASEKGSVLGELKAKKEEIAQQPKKDVIDKATKAKGGEAI